MSTTHVALALDTPADVSALERLVLALIARDADPDGTAAPTLRRIARGANITEPTARRTLHRLTEAGLLHRAAVNDQSVHAWSVVLGSSRDGVEGARS